MYRHSVGFLFQYNIFKMPCQCKKANKRFIYKNFTNASLFPFFLDTKAIIWYYNLNYSFLQKSQFFVVCFRFTIVIFLPYYNLLKRCENEFL